MTWIVAGNTFLGYCFAISDIMVSWGSQYQDECLQKFYSVSDNIAVGFAGSVTLGFRMVEDLKKFIEEQGKEKGKFPEFIIEEWKRRAKFIFEHATQDEQKNQCHLIIMGTSSRKPIVMGQDSFIKTYIYKLASPHFIPYYAKQNEVVTIGSGVKIDKYKEIFNWFNSGANDLLRMHELGPNGMESFMSVVISEQIVENPKFGISKFHHVVSISNTGITIRNNSTDMPKVARGFDDFNFYCVNKGLKAAVAVT